MIVSLVSPHQVRRDQTVARPMRALRSRPRVITGCWRGRRPSSSESRSPRRIQCGADVEIALDPPNGPPFADVELIATLREWDELHSSIERDLALERLESTWPVDAPPGTHRITELSVRPDRQAPGLKVAVEGDRLIVSGPPTGRRSLSIFVHEVNFLARPDRFPGSRSPHLHLEAFRSDDTSAYVQDSLPLVITRLWRDAADEPPGFEVEG